MTELEPSTMLLVNRSNDGEDELPAVEEYFRLLGARVRARLVNRTSANFVVGIESVTAVNLGQIKSVEGIDASGIFSLVRFDKAMLAGGLAVQRSLLTRIIGAMLGDDGESGDEDEDEEEEVSDEPRQLSPVEGKISRRLMDDLVIDLQKAWPSGVAPTVVLDGGPGNGRVIDPSSAQEDVYLSVLSLGTEEEPYGNLAVAIPVQTLRGLNQSKSDSTKKPESREPAMHRVLPVEVDVVAEMARLPMRVRDLQRLRIGDLVPLGPIDGAVVRVNGRTLFHGEPGHSNGQRSIRVGERFES